MSALARNSERDGRTRTTNENCTANESWTRTKYSYDSLYRLTVATTNGSANYVKWGLSMSYDRYGNRLSQSQTYDAPPTNSVTVSATTNQISGSPYAYDANGNMTNDGNNTLVYDAENRLLSATNGGGSGTYAYDGNSLRVKKVSASTTTLYIFSGSKVVAEYVNGAAVGSPTREYVYSGGTLLAKIESGATKYYHQDQLSNRLVTDSSGNVAEQLGHYPFGESWYNATNDKLLFTSYERDSESSNDYAMARYHVNRLARLSSPDSLSGSIGDPQSLNRYVYSLNDSVNIADPSGLHPVYAPALSGITFSSWAFEMFLLGSDSESDLSITAGGVWNGEEWVEQDDPGAIFNLMGSPNLDPPPLGWPMGSPRPPCNLNIRINNRAGISGGQLSAAETQIGALFGSYVGLNFVNSGSSDYTLNVVNAASNNSYLGLQTSFWFFQGTPAVYPNNITNYFSGQPPSVISNIIGTVGAHELVHRINGIGDLPYTRNSPTDLMSVDTNPNFSKLFINNGLSLTQNEGMQLQNKCLQKHPE
jgi:RHS repeat-associated protein